MYFWEKALAGPVLGACYYISCHSVLGEATAPNVTAAGKEGRALLAMHFFFIDIYLTTHDCLLEYHFPFSEVFFILQLLKIYSANTKINMPMALKRILELLLLYPYMHTTMLTTMHVNRHFGAIADDIMVISVSYLSAMLNGWLGL